MLLNIPWPAFHPSRWDRDRERDDNFLTEILYYYPSVSEPGGQSGPVRSVTKLNCSNYRTLWEGWEGFQPVLDRPDQQQQQQLGTRGELRLLSTYVSAHKTTPCPFYSSASSSSTSSNTGFYCFSSFSLIQQPPAKVHWCCRQHFLGLICSFNWIYPNNHRISLPLGIQEEEEGTATAASEMLAYRCSCNLPTYQRHLFIIFFIVIAWYSRGVARRSFHIVEHTARDDKTQQYPLVQSILLRKSFETYISSKLHPQGYSANYSPCK